MPDLCENSLLASEHFSIGPSLMSLTLYVGLIRWVQDTGRGINVYYVCN